MRRSSKALRLKPVRRGDKTYWYARAPHGLVPMPNLPHDDPAFLAAYHAAMQTQPTVGKHVAGSIARALDDYTASQGYTALAAATQRQRGQHLAAIGRRWGVALLADLAERHIEDDLRALAPHAANNRLKAWRGFTAWAKAEGALAGDCGAAVRRRKVPRSQGHAPWTLDEVEAFREWWHPETPQRKAMEVLFWTGARISDAVKFHQGMIDRQGWLCFRQTKTGGEVVVPFARELPGWAAHMSDDLATLRAFIDGMPGTWLATATGQRSAKAAASWFSGAATAAGVDKTAHGLRKLRAALLAESGASAHQIGTWLGHESLAEVQRYARNADRRRILSA